METVGTAYETHIGVPSDLLDDLIIKVPGVAKEPVGDLVCVFDAAEHLVADIEAAPPELRPSVLTLPVDLLDP